MKNILIIAYYTFLRCLRHRFLPLLFGFGLLLLVMSGLLGVLAQEQSQRIFLDSGLAAIEALAVFMSVFFTAQLVYQEIESRSIYLILSRPVRRAEYVLGTFKGIATSVLFLMMSLCIFHVSFLKEHSLPNFLLTYFLIFCTMLEKVIIMSAASMLFSMIASSLISSIIFSIFFWILGGISTEIYFLIQQLSWPLNQLGRGIYFFIPHWEFLNGRDLFFSGSISKANFLMQSVFYTFSASAVYLSLAILVFRKKEF